ncbi:membrane protease YdiL (CAAX protease family) [Enterococcus sp. PF1-24]|uniref:CPBP family intramembrane glutamic endopeptidase n=1 Tax=unclassified Enterococcus TaxID=2608891 RepID=UPI002476D156|nr:MULTISPECIES: type II CAAX endopeptidase family protein [unclassified Enterococcus]MDH6365558.1 membrane protease YdiL (CAAX protease family) [Enterococcus sp. PFB1-1]MDH6402652.1 membrane protease YdiL (CAAX protease family) [Enterococcus sp. PF1-24]
MQDRKKANRLYLILTFSISWLCWLVVAGITHFTKISLFSPIALPLYSIGAAGPMISALIVKKKRSSAKEYREFKKKIINFKQPLTAYFLVFFMGWSFCFFPVLLGGSQQIGPVYIFLQQLPVMIFFGGGLEEVGWRGYLLPELQHRFSSFWSTCILSVIWTVWHLPLWLVKGSGQDTTNLIGFMLFIGSMAFLLTLLWNRYESIVLCMLLHASFNSFTDVYPADFSNLWLSSALLLVCLFFYWGTTRFLLQSKIKQG